MNLYKGIMNYSKGDEDNLKEGKMITKDFIYIGEFSDLEPEGKGEITFLKTNYVYKSIIKRGDINKWMEDGTIINFDLLR